MAIIDLADLDSVDADFEINTTADPTIVNTVINDIRADLLKINSGGMVKSAIEEEIGTQISDNPISVDLSNSIPILYGIQFSTSTESSGRRITLLSGDPTRYIVYRNKTFTVGSITNSYFTDQVVYYDFGDDDLAGHITFDVATINALPALHATKRRFIFAILSYIGDGTTSIDVDDWHLSVVVQSELLHAGLLQAGTIDADRIAATSIVVGKLNADATIRMFGTSANATNVQAWIDVSDPTDTTKIDGGKIQTGTIIADSIDTDTLGATSIKIVSGGIISSQIVEGSTNRLFQQSGEEGFFLGYNASGSPGETTAGYAFDLMDSNGNGLSYNTGRSSGSQFKLHGTVVNGSVMEDHSATKIHRYADYLLTKTARIKILTKSGQGTNVQVDDIVHHPGDYANGTAVVVSTSADYIIIDNVRGDFGSSESGANDYLDIVDANGDLLENGDNVVELAGNARADYGYAQNEKPCWAKSSGTGSPYNVGVRWGTTVSTTPFVWTPVDVGANKYCKVTVDFVLRIDAGGNSWVAFKVTDEADDDNMIYASSNFKVNSGTSAEGAAIPMSLSFIVDLTDEPGEPPAGVERKYQLWGSSDTGINPFRSFVGNIYWQAEEFMK